MWKLLGAILVLHFNDLLHGKLVGDHVCLTEESYITNVTEHRIRNATVRNYQWCMNMPPRCSFYTNKVINETRIVEKNLTRTVEKCCAGFLEEDDKCVSTCKGCKNGLCQEGKCLCSAGYTGHSCEVACGTGRWGRNCSFECSCPNKKCDPKNGLCMPENSSTISHIETSEIFSTNTTKDPTTPVYQAETNPTSTIASTKVSVAESSTTHTTPAIVSATTISSTKVNVDESSTTHSTPTIVRLETVSAKSPEATTHAHSTSAITTSRESTAHTRTTIANTSPTASFKETGIVTDFPPPTTSIATTARSILMNNVASNKITKSEHMTTSSIDKNINGTSTPTPQKTVTTNKIMLAIPTNSLKTSTEFLSTISSKPPILINNVNVASDKTKETEMVNLSSTNPNINHTNTTSKTRIMATMKEQINKISLNITDNHTLAVATETAKNVQTSLDDYKEYLIPVEVHYDQITRPIIKKDALTTTPNNFADEKSFLTVYDKEYIDKHISEEKNKVVVNFSIAGTSILVIVVIAVSLLGIALLWRSRNKKKNVKDNNEICPAVSIYTTSIFHTPLPDPPTFENLTYLTPTDLGVKLNEQISFKSHIANPKSVELAPIKVKDYREYVYDHPPSTGSYRAASSIEPIESNLNHRLAEIEPVYDEIPQRCQDVAETSFCYDCQSDQPTSLYVNTCGRTKF